MLKFLTNLISKLVRKQQENESEGERADPVKVALAERIRKGKRIRLHEERKMKGSGAIGISGADGAVQGGGQKHGETSYILDIEIDGVINESPQINPNSTKALADSSQEDSKKKPPSLPPGQQAGQQTEGENL